MKKALKKTLLLITLMIFIFYPNIYAFSNDIFEFDLPSSYGNISYQGIYVFADSNNEDRGFTIYAMEDTSIKKSVWDIEQSDINDLVRKLSYSSNVIDTNRRAKLGKEKAVEVILSDNGNYMDMYILASNKYIYIVAFVGNSQEDLNNSDYEMIKDSFKLKDRTTNYGALRIIGIVIIAVVGIFIKIKKSNNRLKYNNYNPDTINYKDLTEDDFNNMN